MEFQVEVNGVVYNVHTSQESKSSYLVEHNNDQVEITLGDSNEWTSLHQGRGKDPIPVTEIGEAIQSHFH